MRNGNSDYAAGYNSAAKVYRIAVLAAQARVAAAEGKSDAQIALLRNAVTDQDQLDYDEPADWFFPLRHELGAALLKAGKASEAEAVYRADLARNPANGWALFGLAQTLHAQGRTADAATARKQFDAAWTRADITLAASAF